MYNVLVHVWCHCKFAIDPKWKYNMFMYERIQVTATVALTVQRNTRLATCIMFNDSMCCMSEAFTCRVDVQGKGNSGLLEKVITQVDDVISSSTDLGNPALFASSLYCFQILKGCVQDFLLCFRDWVQTLVSFSRVVTIGTHFDWSLCRHLWIERMSGARYCLISCDRRVCVSVF